MSSFYELSKELCALEARADSEDIEETEFLAALNAISLEAEQKCSAIGGWMHSLDAIVEARKSEIRRLQDMNKHAENLKERLKNYVLQWLQRTDQQSLKTPLASFSRRKPSTRLVVDEEKVLDWSAEFFERAEKAGAVRVRYEVNKSELRRVNGFLDQPGVAEIEGDESLVVR